MVISLSGRLDAITASGALIEIESHTGSPPGAFILDCSELLYLSSAGLRVLMQLAQKSGGKLTLIGLNENTREVIEISGLGCVLNIK